LVSIATTLGSQIYKAQSLWIGPYFLSRLMPYWVYIIQSQTTGRYYCGHSDNVERPLNQNNNPKYYGSHTTKVFQGPWSIIWTQECANKSKAVVLETKIKKRGIGRYLETELAESACGGLTTGSISAEAIAEVPPNGMTSNPCWGAKLNKCFSLRYMS